MTAKGCNRNYSLFIFDKLDFKKEEFVMKNRQGVLYLIPKSSYYDSEKDMVAEGKRLHADMFNEDRELYTYLLYFKEATYYSKSLMMNNLLTNSLHKEENSELLKRDPDLLKVEDALIMHALFNENITHALKMLLTLKESRLNNSRTSRIILQFIFDRGNTDTIAIKYRNKLKQLLIHALGLRTVNEILDRTYNGVKKFEKAIAIYDNPYAMEVFEFVFGRETEFKSPKLQEYMRMKKAFENNSVDFREPTDLPIEVLIGFNNFYKTGYALTSLIGLGNLSKKQKIQMQNTVKRHSNDKMELKIDLNEYSIMELYKYMYSKKDITPEEIEECASIIEGKATELHKRIEDNFIVDLNNTALIIDCSDSNKGSAQTKLHPFFKNITLGNVLKGDKDIAVTYVGGIKEDGLFQPSGHTDLSSALLKVAKEGYKNVIILSDGFENVNNFDKTYKQLKKIGYDLNVIHFNPVFSPKNFSFKEISPDIVAIPYTSEKDIENLMLFYLLNVDGEQFKKVMREKIESELLA